MTATPRLFIVGDSFTQPRKETQTATTWIDLVQQQLSQHHGAEVAVINKSFYGVAQDFCWLFLQLWAEAQEIKPWDYIIVALTHPNRYWYFEKHPDLSNGLGMIGMNEHVEPYQLEAVKSYILHIQRPSLDSVQMISRLGWLAHAVDHYGWPRPLVIPCFEFDTFDAKNYANLNWARGCLYDIQNSEFAPDSGDNATTEYFSGIDCRYNHLSLCNHRVLGPRVARSLISGTQLDLAEGYHQNIMPATAESDREFADREWCNEQMELYYQRKAEIKIKRFKRWT